ncbi:MAG TPA: hypothetical protein VMF11_04400 [Candidatus Baltobacteraceae bacterium]|nr:hypothetical protein [Candidatus Baltobacteraceae bacterium]
MKQTVAFLPDEDSLGLGRSIRGYPVLTYREVGLSRGASDIKVEEHGRRHNAIVLSRNRRDFRRVMRDIARVSTSGECQAMRCKEGGGLVTVDPRLKSFNFARVSKSLVLGGQRIDWDDVFVLNLRVHIGADERVTVTLLPRCERCLRLHSFECERCDQIGIVTLYERQFGVVIAPPWADFARSDER